MLKRLPFFALVSLLSSPAFAGSQTVYETDFDVHYGRIADLVGPQINEALGGFVRVDNCKDVRAKEYRCGELPAGKILSESEKRLFQLVIKANNGKKGDVDYHLGGGSADIILSRSQRKGTIRLADLDTVKVTDLETSNALGANVYMGLFPKGADGLGLYTCMNIPGITAHAEPVTLHGNLHKRMPWYLPDIHATLTVHVKSGRMSFDAGKLCAQFHLAMDAKGLPKVTFEKLGKLQVTGFEHDGLKVTASANTGGFWGFIDPFLRAFGVNIEGMIADQVRKQALAEARKAVDIQAGDVKSGVWLEKYLTASHLERLTENFSKSLRKQFQEAGLGKKEIDDTIDLQCLAASQLAPQAIRDRVFKICRFSAKVRVQYFVNDKAQREKGCYGNYFDPRRSFAGNQPKWWREGCQLVNHATVSVTGQVADVLQCLQVYGNKGTVSPRCQSVLQGFFTDLVAGRMDQLLQQITSAPRTPPTDQQLQQFRVAAAQIGVTLPPVAVLKTYWR
jgi:hypothetical protein